FEPGFRNISYSVSAAPNDISRPDAVRERSLDIYRLAGRDNNIVRKGAILCAEPAMATSHHQAAFLVDERLEDHQPPTTAIVPCEFVGRNQRVAIADVNRLAAVFEIIAKDLVVLAEDANAFRAKEEIPVDDVEIAVAQGQFAAPLTERIKPIRILARFIAD